MRDGFALLKSIFSSQENGSHSSLEPLSKWSGLWALLFYSGDMSYVYFLGNHAVGKHVDIQRLIYASIFQAHRFEISWQWQRELMMRVARHWGVFWSYCFYVL